MLSDDRPGSRLRLALLTKELYDVVTIINLMHLPSSATLCVINKIYLAVLKIRSEFICIIKRIK